MCNNTLVFRGKETLIESLLVNDRSYINVQIERFFDGLIKDLTTW